MIKQICEFCLLVTILATIACSGSSGTRTASVTVTNLTGNRLPGVTVVLGDSNGAMKASGSTNANGDITFSGAPTNATVSAALSCLRTAQTITTYSLDIRYDVNEPVTLSLDDCSSIPGSSGSTNSDVLGTVTINVTNAISGVTQNEISTNMAVFSGLPAIVTQMTITIGPYDLQQDGKLSVYVMGKDASGSTIGYGMLLDQTFTDGMTVNITVDKPVSFVQYHLTNLPLAANYLCTGLYQMRTGKGGTWIDDCRTLSSSSSTTTVNVAYIPGLGDQFDFSGDVFVNQNSVNTYVSSSQYLSLGPSSSLADQNVDFSKALSAPSGLSVTGTDTATPALVWTGLDPAADSCNLFAYFQLASGFSWYLYIDDLSPKRASIKFPELPDSLAAFRPTTVRYFSVYTYDSGNGLFRASDGSYYNLQAFAPPLNKAASLPELQRLQRYRQL